MKLRCSEDELLISIKYDKYLIIKNKLALIKKMNQEIKH